MPQSVIPVSAAYVRLALRVYFTVILTLVSFIGDQCCIKRVKLELARNRQVSLPHLTGWLSGTSAAFAAWKLGTSPAGWLGYFMFLCSLLWIAGDLAVSALVTAVAEPSRCPFNTTGKYQVVSVVQFEAFIGVTNVGPLYNLINQAQSTSLRNGGLDGIYKKVNEDLYFRADSSDILGRWICQDDGIKMTYSNTTSPDFVLNDLVSRGILFSESTWGCWVTHPDHTNSNEVFLSASETENSRTVWDVRVLIDVTDNGRQGTELTQFTCKMDAPSVEWILAQTYPQESITEWCSVVLGDIWSNNSPDAVIVSDPGATIASAFNTMIMQAGTAWNDTSSPIIILDPTQGCLAFQALLPWPVLLLFALVTVIFLGATTYWTFLTIRLRGVSTKGSQQPPSGLLTWMKQAVHETRPMRDIKLRGLKMWSFTRGQDGNLILRDTPEPRRRDYRVRESDPTAIQMLPSTAEFRRERQEGGDAFGPAVGRSVL